MMAAVLYGKEHLQVEPVSVPKIDDGDILVRVRVALTCGTDVKVFRRGYHARMIVPPAVFGHELAGDVVAVGEGVDGFQVGQRVVAANSAPCEECFFCRRGLQNLCEDLLFNNGAYAEYIRIPARIVERNTYRIPAARQLSGCRAGRAAGLRGARASKRPAPRPGDTVAMIGPGSHRADVREAGQAVRLPRDRHRPAQARNWNAPRPGRRRADCRADDAIDPV